MGGRRRQGSCAAKPREPNVPAEAPWNRFGVQHQRPASPDWLGFARTYKAWALERGYWPISSENRTGRSNDATWSKTCIALPTVPSECGASYIYNVSPNICPIHFIRKSTPGQENFLTPTPTNLLTSICESRLEYQYVKPSFII